MSAIQQKNVWWLYQARRVNTQTNAGGGALTTRISFPSGQVAKLVNIYAYGTASVTSTFNIQLVDEDGQNNGYVTIVAAGVTRTSHLPSIGTAANTNENLANTTDMIFGPGSFISIQSSVALLNELQTISVVFLLSTPTIPTWDTTGSAGTPSLAASTISAANELQAVVM